MKRFAVLTAFALVAGLLQVPALAQTNATAYVVHAINGQDLGLPKSARVDVSANGACVLPGFTYGTITDGLSLPPGAYEIVVSLADDAPCSGPAVIEATVRLRHEETAAIVAHLDESGTPTAGKFVLDTDALRRPYSRFYVVHAANAPTVDVTFSKSRERAGHSAAIAGVSNGEYGLATVSGDAWKARIYGSPDGSRVVGPLKLKLGSGLVYVVYAAGTLANGTFDLLVQAIPAG